MPISDAGKRRKTQRELKSRQRSDQKLLMAQLDIMIPPTSVTFNPASPTRTRRTAMQLLQDLIAYLRSLEGLAGDQSRKRKRVCYRDIISTMLLSSRERVIVVDIPSWTIRDVSARVESDFCGSCFGGRLVGQCMLHLVGTGDMETLRMVSRKAWDAGGAPEFGLDEVVSMRLMEGGKIRLERFRMTGVVNKEWCMSIVYLEPLGPDSDEIELKQLDFRRLQGVVTFDQSSQSSPWLVDRAMKIISGRS
eukprot:754990-Hanusia_phi.AAC.1